jgi:hypothetical protein
LKISLDQFEQIKALVVQETGAVVAFYDKKEFGNKKSKLEGYASFEDPFRIFVCRSTDTTCFTRATLTLLHEYGHLIDYMKHKDSKRLKVVVINGIPAFNPLRRSYKDAIKLTKEEKVWLIKTEWYANEYAKLFAKKHGFDFLSEQLNIEQVTDYRYIHFDLVQGVPTTRPQRRAWRRVLKEHPLNVTLKDVNELFYI